MVMEVYEMSLNDQPMLRAVRSWGVSMMLLGALLPLGGCEKPDTVAIPSKPAVKQLVVVTPHSNMICSAFEDAFSDWHKERHGSYVEILWDIKGTPQCMQYVQEAGRPDFVPAGRPIPDVFFGGGPLEHQMIADKSLSRPVDVSDIESDLPVEVMGTPTRDAQNRWHSSALSSFGLLVARQGCRQRGIAEPTSWRELADPRFYGWLAIADPERSGSNRQCLLVILQKYGWDEGWGIIMRIAANCRALAAGSSEVIHNVSTGNCLAGFCVNFNALRQREQCGGDVLAYVIPSDAGMITPDPISVLTYALHPETGARFARFCVSEAGQGIWGFKAEFRTGHSDTLFRYPINPKFYSEHKEKLAVPDNPFEMQSIVLRDRALEEKQSRIVGPLLLAACGDNHVMLQRCWKDIFDSGMNEAALGELLKPVMSESEAYESGIRYRQDREAAADLLESLSELFRQKYERVNAILAES